MKFAGSVPWGIGWGGGGEWELIQLGWQVVNLRRSKLFTYNCYDFILKRTEMFEVYVREFLYLVVHDCLYC